MRWNRWMMVGLLGAVGWAQVPVGGAVDAPLVEGKRALAMKDFVRAKGVFGAYLRTHAGDVQGELGLGDAELGMRRYEAAELHYRRVVAAQPLLWAAHKNLVIVEAALGRWEDFDGERAVLRAARSAGMRG